MQEPGCGKQSFIDKAFLLQMSDERPCLLYSYMSNIGAQLAGD